MSEPWDDLPTVGCLVCLAAPTWPDVKHEPWCPAFMRCVDESADAQLALGDEG